MLIYKIDYKDLKSIIMVVIQIIFIISQTINHILFANLTINKKSKAKIYN